MKHQTSDKRLTRARMRAREKEAVPWLLITLESLLRVLSRSFQLLPAAILITRLFQALVGIMKYCTILMSYKRNRISRKLGSRAKQ